MILADTSVWVDHLRKGNRVFSDLLLEGQIVTHPWVVAELALGSLQNRKALLAQLDSLLEVKVAQISELRSMIEYHHLYARGIGLTDAHLLASCLLSPGTLLWTLDRRLAEAAAALTVNAKLA